MGHLESERPIPDRDLNTATALLDELDTALVECIVGVPARIIMKLFRWLNREDKNEKTTDRTENAR
jgi:hypothetical protein